MCGSFANFSTHKNARLEEMAFAPSSGRFALNAGRLDYEPARRYSGDFKKGTNDEKGNICLVRTIPPRYIALMHSRDISFFKHLEIKS